MAAKSMDWLGIAGAFIRLRPQASIALAFELGIMAAEIVHKSGKRRGNSSIPSKLIELAPSIGDLGGFLDRSRRAKPATPKRARKAAVQRTPRVKKES